MFFNYFIVTKSSLLSLQHVLLVGKYILYPLISQFLIKVVNMNGNFIVIIYKQGSKTWRVTKVTQKNVLKFFEFETSQSIIHWLRQTFFKAQFSFDLCWLLRKQTTNSQCCASSYQYNETIATLKFINIYTTALNSPVWGRRWLGFRLLYWWYYCHLLTYPASSMASD